MKKTNSHITPKNLENILKLFLKAQEKKKSKKKRKNYKSKKYSHEQHRNEHQGNILMTNLNNVIKENEYRKEVGLNKDDDKNNKLLLKFIDNNNDLLKKFIEYPERKLLTYKEEKKDDIPLSSILTLISILEFLRPPIPFPAQNFKDWNLRFLAYYFLGP